MSYIDDVLNGTYKTKKQKREEEEQQREERRAEAERTKQ